MSLRKCSHGVLIPSWQDGEESAYCSGCTPPYLVDSQVDKRIIYFPKGHGFCPKCGSDRFYYENDWRFHCSNCGANELTVRGLDDEYTR